MGKVATFWLKNYEAKGAYEDKMYGFISKGFKYYTVYLGDLTDKYLNKNSFKIKIAEKVSSINAAKEILKKHIKELRIPYYIYTFVDEYYQGDHCRLKYESFNAEGKEIESYYESSGSLNRYLYYSVGEKDVLYARKEG